MTTVSASNFTAQFERETYDIKLHSLGHDRGYPFLSNVYARDVLFSGFDEDNSAGTRIKFIYQGDIRCISPDTTGSGTSAVWFNVTKDGHASPTWELRRSSGSTKRVKKDIEYVGNDVDIDLSSLQAAFFNLKDNSNGAYKVLSLVAETLGVLRNPGVTIESQERYDPKYKVSMPIDGNPSRELPINGMYGGDTFPVFDFDTRAVVAMLLIVCKMQQKKMGEIYTYVKGLMAGT